MKLPVGWRVLRRWGESASRAAALVRRWLLQPLIIAALAGALTGCSTLRLSYTQAPTLAWWWLDRLVDFSSAQKPAVQAALRDWQAWHRSTQLPDYQQALAQLRPQLAEPMTAAQVCEQVTQWQQRALTAVVPLLPAAASLAPGLSAAQLRHLDQRFAKELAEAEKDHLQPDLDERREAALKRAVERAEQLYGRLDEAQRRLLAEGLAASPFDPQRWLDERRARQQDLLQTLREAQAGRLDEAALRERFQQLAQGVVSSPRPAWRQQALQVQQAQCELSARLHNATSARQRRVAQDRIKGWEDDLRALQMQQAAR